MSITPFTVILLFFYLRLLLVKDQKIRFMYSFVMTMVCTVVIYMGYFVSFENGSSIPYSIISWLSCTFFAFGLNRRPSKGRKQIKKVISKRIFFYIICISITIISFYLYRYGKLVIMDSDYENFIIGKGTYTTLKSDSFKYGYVYISLMFCYVIYTMYKYLDKDDFLFIGNKFINYSTASIIIGYIEFITENLFQTLFVTNSTILFFGEAESQQTILTFDRGWSNIQAFTKEASMYSTSVLYSLIVALNMIVLTNENRKYYKYSIAAFILLLLNSSMSSYVYAFLLLIFVVFMQPFGNEIKYKKTSPKLAVFIVIGIVFVLVCAQTLLSNETYLSTRINESLLQFSNFQGQGFTNSSEGVRYLGITHCLSIFVDRPLFGIGFGCVTCVSGIVTLLTNIGLIGVIAYFILIWPVIKLKKTDSIFVVSIIVFAPNLLLNDLNTMFALIIPYTLAFTAYSIQIKTNFLNR